MAVALKRHERANAFNLVYFERGLVARGGFCRRVFLSVPPAVSALLSFALYSLLQPIQIHTVYDLQQISANSSSYAVISWLL